MKSIKDYKKNNIGYYNSLHASITEPIYIGESLVINRGKDMDSIFHKLNIYEYRQHKGSYIHESYINVNFDFNEQFAARDMFVNIAESYAQQLCDDFCEEYGINESFNWKESWNKTKDYFSKLSDKAKEAYNELKSTLKELAEFIKEVTSKAIKTAKEMVDKFIDMILKIKKGVGELIQKFGGNVKEIQKEFESAIAEAMNSKGKASKENIYESLGIQLSNGISINEAWFNRKKDKEESKQEDNSNNTKKKKSDEYTDAANAKASKDDKKGGWKQTVLNIITQITLSVGTLVIVPAIIGCVWGGPAAIIAATIAKFLMSGYAAFKLIKDIRETFKSNEWEKLTKFQKGCKIVMWVLAIGSIAWGSSKAFSDAGKIITAFKENTLSQLLPDEAVQNAMKIINNIWKSLTGENAVGYDKMMNVINGGLTKLETVTTEVKVEGGEMGQDVKEIAKEFNNTDFSSSKGAWDNYLSTKNIPLDKIPDNSTLSIVLDGSQDAKHAKIVIDFLMKNGADNMSVSDGFNAGLNGMNKMAGSIFTLENVPKEALQKAIDAGLEIGNNGLFSVVGAVTKETTKTVLKTIATKLPGIAGGFAPTMAIPKIIFKERGKFRLRMGSSRTGYDVYTIQAGKDGLKPMTFSEAQKEYENNNKAMFGKMLEIIKTNKETLEASLKKLEEQDKLSRDDKKKTKAINQSLEKIKEEVIDLECLVFFSDTVIESEETETQTNEGLFSKSKNKEEKKVKYKPIAIYVPFVMSFGDLTNQRGENKPPRKKLIPFNGLFASYEFLPVDGGMSKEEIADMLKDWAYGGVQAAYNCCIDVPCVKEGGKLVVNKESKAKGKRVDFGEFDNEQITEILNSKGSSVIQYLGGNFKAGSSTVEKENTDSQKERKAKAKEEWKENIEKDNEIQELIKNSKTLKKNLLDKDGNVKSEAIDELTDYFLRVENSYIKNPEEKKKFFKKVKEFFTGKKEEDKVVDKYDNSELSKLAFKLASLHKEKLKKRKKKIEESNTEWYNGEYDEIYERLFILEANMHLFEGEFEDFLNNGDMIFENYEENDSFKFVED